MLKSRKIWLTAFLLGLGCVLGADAHAGDKKVEVKKGPPAKGATVLKKSGELKDDDEKDAKLQESPSQKFPIKLKEGKTYRIDLTSGDFDSFLRLLDSKGEEVAFDDDGGGFPNARITYKATKGGDFKIVVTSYDKKAGAFMLTVVEVGGKAAPVGGSKFTAKAVELKLKGGKLSHDGELTDKDPTVQNHYYKVFTVKLEKDTTYRIDYKERGGDATFDAYLFLEDADGNAIANDDDSGGGLNSRIVYKAAKTGLYRIITTTLPAQQTGKFTLQISPPTADEAKAADLKHRIDGIASLTKAQRKTLVDEVRKQLADKDGDLSIAQAQLVFQLATQLEADDIKLAREFYKSAIKEFSAARDAKISAQITGALENALKSLEKIGTVIEITGMTTDGKEYDLKKFKGKVVLVDFWATWCGPCIAELPNMEKAYAKYHSRGFEIIGVSLDRPGDDEKLTKFMDNRKMPWPCINIEDSRKLANAQRVNAIPYPVLIGADGRVVSIRARGPQLERLLEALLPEKK